MSIIVTILIGLGAGILAKPLMCGRDPGGFIITVCLGILGAIVATFLGYALGWYNQGEAAGFIGALIGSVMLPCIVWLQGNAGRRD